MADAGKLTEAECMRLIAAHGTSLVGYFRGRGVRPDDADDRAQDVWARLLADVRSGDDDGYDPKRGTTFYIYVIARYARWAIVPAKPPDSRKSFEPPELVEDQPDGSMGPVELLLGREFRLFAFRELFRLVFLFGGYPHQQLAFALSKHIYGRQTPRGVDGASTAVQTLYGSTPLDVLLDVYLKAYVDESRINDPVEIALLQEYLEPVRTRLGLTIDELFKSDSASRKAFAGDGAELVGQTCLRQYYINYEVGHTAAISEWCSKVKDKIYKCLGLKRTATLEAAMDRVAESRRPG